MTTLGKRSRYQEIGDDFLNEYFTNSSLTRSPDKTQAELDSEKVRIDERNKFKQYYYDRTRSESPSPSHHKSLSDMSYTEKHKRRLEMNSVMNQANRVGREIYNCHLSTKITAMEQKIVKLQTHFNDDSRMDSEEGRSEVVDYVIQLHKEMCKERLEDKSRITQLEEEIQKLTSEKVENEHAQGAEQVVLQEQGGNEREQFELYAQPEAMVNHVPTPTPSIQSSSAMTQYDPLHDLCVGDIELLVPSPFDQRADPF